MPPKSKNFETERTRRFRDDKLCPEDEDTISNIEEFGCSIVHVERTTHGLGWSYTIGIFDTSGKPDIITVGLRPQTAQVALNEAAKLLRAGTDLSRGRHRELIGEVECEFRSVDPKWVSHVMNWAVWYYNGATFPVLQAVYPDLDNRFPEEEGFDKRFEQPLLQLAVPWTRAEEDFWASTDPKSSLFTWKFPNPPHAAAFLSKAVDNGNEPITFVSHDAEDGAWQFLGDSMSDAGGVLVCLHHPIDRDRSLVELADLPLGWYAERNSIGDPWIRRPMPPRVPSE